MTTTEPTTRPHSHDDDPNSLPVPREHSLDPGGNSLATRGDSPGLAGLVLLDVDALVPDRRNQRRPLDAELVASVAAHGVLEPVLAIAEPDQAGTFRIVAGERRWRAARKAGLAAVPAIVRDLSEAEIAEIQLVENLARADLAPTQAAAAMARCIEVGMGVKDLAARIGRSPRWVTVRLRLLELPPPARRLVDHGTWSLDDATAAAKLLDHPEELTELIDQDPTTLTGPCGWLSTASTVSGGPTRWPPRRRRPGGQWWTTRATHPGPTGLSPAMAASASTPTRTPASRATRW